MKAALKKIWETIRLFLISDAQLKKEKELEQASAAKKLKESKLLDEPVIFPSVEEPFQFSEKELQDLLNDGKEIKPLAKKELKEIDQIWQAPVIEKGRQAEVVVKHSKAKVKKPAKKSIKKAAKKTKRAAK